MKPPKIEKIQQDLSKLDGNYEVLLFGSAIEGGFRPESDIDIAVLSRNRNISQNTKLQLELIQKFGMQYDIHVFELLPLIVQVSIVQNYKVIFGDSLEISEYLYQTRKEWEDCKYRIMQNQFSSFRERLEILEAQEKKNNT